jgi:hypothetical protein
MAIKVRIIREAKKKGVDGKECWDGYKYAGSEDTDGDGKDDKDKCVPMKKEEKSIEEIIDKIIEEVIQEIDKDRMKCNKPRYLKKGEPGYGKKQKVVKACKKGKEKLVKFGDAKMRNNSDKPKNKTDFRKRHNCSDKEDNMKAGYWACKDW